MPTSNFVLILLGILVICSSYDAANHYFEVKKLLLNVPVKIGIAATSISLFFLCRALVFIFLNIFCINATITISDFEPTFTMGEQVFGIYSKFYRKEYQRGDFVLFRSTSYYGVTTIGRIVGKPMENIEIKYSNVYVNGSILLPMDYQLVKISDNINETFVSDSTHFVVITFTPNGIFEQIPKDNIIAKILCVISPPERRRIIR
jgi:signal peptidase I